MRMVRNSGTRETEREREGRIAANHPTTFINDNTNKEHTQTNTKTKGSKEGEREVDGFDRRPTDPVEEEPLSDEKEKKSRGELDRKDVVVQFSSVQYSFFFCLLFLFLLVFVVFLHTRSPARGVNAVGGGGGGGLHVALLMSGGGG